MAVPKTKSSVTNFPATTRKGTLAKDTPTTGTGTGTGGSTDAAPTTLKTTITGNITIGSGTDKFSVPVQSLLPPPAGANGFVFYLVNDPSQTTKIPVGEFISWAFQQLSGGTAPALPSSLQNFTVALQTLNFDTGGDFDIKVELGSGTGSAWQPTWQPMGTNIPLSLDAVTLEFVKGTIPPKPTT